MYGVPTLFYVRLAKAYVRGCSVLQSAVIDSAVIEIPIHLSTYIEQHSHPLSGLLGLKGKEAGDRKEGWGSENVV